MVVNGTPAREAPADDANDSENELNLSDEEGAVRVDGIYIPPAPVPYCSAENKGPRLVINKIVNHFFKSYAENVVLGTFHKAFNAIIGPNGSGKSNVIDSMLFVFGFRANRMRSKRLSVLIHNSPKHRNVQSATVSVHFSRIIDKTDDDFETVPGSEFVVSRTVNKDNSSYYTIGDRRVHFKEVAVLLKDNGIDLKHNRFLILQGEVEQIAMMPAKMTGADSGMLEYLEDIIGTTRYKEPLLQLAERVEEYWDKRIEKANRLKIVQDEVEVLREPMEEAVEFLKLENSIAREKNIIYQHNIYATKSNAKDIVQERNDLGQKMDVLMEKLNNIAGQKKEKEAALQEVTKKFSIMEKRKESLQEAYQSANSQHATLQMQMQQLNENRHKFKDQLVAEKKKLETYKQQPEECDEKIEECQKAIEKLRPKVEEMQNEKMRMLATMKDLTKDLQEEKEVLIKELDVLTESATATKTALSLAESELKLLTSASDKEAQKLHDLEAMYVEITTRIEQLTNETAKLMGVVPEKEAQVTEANAELPQIKQQEQRLLHQLRSTRSKIEESRANMQASRSKNRVLDALMQQKNEGQLPGFYGRLGDLGAIDAKYDVAISTACGPLDNIVVDTVETGQRCIEFLKQHDIGRATIIVLALQQHLAGHCDATPRTPENASRLFDLVRIPDARFRPAFYYALRDTLVADDLEQATRIAYGEQRFRVVTLKGELIETTGAMSGGGGRVMRGRMGQSVRVDVHPQDVAQMEQSMAQSERLLAEARQQAQRYENVLATTQPELKQMKIALEKWRIELGGLKQREPNVAAQIEEQRGKVKRVSINVDQVRRLQADVEGKTMAFNAATERATVVQTKVDELTHEIKQKSHGEIKVLDSKLKDCERRIDRLKAEVTKLKVGAKTADKNASKAEKTIECLLEEVKAAESGLLEMKAKRDEIEQDAEKLQQLLRELEASISGGSEEYADLKNDVNELEKSETKRKSEKIELDQALRTVQEKLNEIDQRVHAYRMKLSNLKLQEVPAEETEPFRQYADDELEEIDVELSVKQVGLYEVRLKASKPNLAAIEEYRKKVAASLQRSKELQEVVEKWQEVRATFDGLRNRRRDEFMAGYNIIKHKLKEMYQMITIGGDADLELVDTYDPFSEGVLLRVRPPKKTWKQISNLSGGEKTLSSLSLVFALHYYKPSPLYVLDEIDAALDFKNVSIISNYIKERTKNAQFIIISLRNEMFELSSHLVGIFKPDNTTMASSINPKAYETRDGTERNGVANAELGRVCASDTIEMIDPDTLASISATAVDATTDGAANERMETSALPESQDMFASQCSSRSCTIAGTPERAQAMEVD